jgi:hypothetical protein
LFGSPAGSLRASAEYIIFLRFALFYKAAASCSALRAVLVFAKKKAKTHTSPSLLHVPSGAFVPQASLSATLAPLADGSRFSREQSANRSCLTHCSLFPSVFSRSVYPDFYRDAFSFVRNHQIIKLLNNRKKKEKKETSTVAVETGTTPTASVQN